MTTSAERAYDLAGQAVWPLVLLLIAVYGVRQLRDDLNPIFKSLVNGLSQNAGKNSTAVATAILFGLSASLSAFWDIFHSMDRAALMAMSWHQYAAQWSKVLNPFIVAVLAYATNSNRTNANGPTGNTVAPFGKTTP